MIIFNKLYIDEKIRFKNNVISKFAKIPKKGFKKNYFVLLYDFNSNETFDIICTSHLPNISNVEKLVVCGIAKTKQVAVLQSQQFFQDILDTGADIMNFDMDKYILENSKKE